MSDPSEHPHNPNPSPITMYSIARGSDLASNLKQVPTSSWWATANHAFHHIQHLISTPRSPPFPSRSSADDEIRRLRENSLPKILLFPSGTHALGITATNESLRCIAFGTMRMERFVDCFWEAVEGEDVVVHEILDGRIILTVEGHELSIAYVQAERLLREYSDDVTGAPAEFLDECSDVVRNAVDSLFSKRGQHANMVQRRIAYHYIRNMVSIPTMLLRRLLKILKAIKKGVWSTEREAYGFHPDKLIPLFGSREAYKTTCISSIVCSFLQNEPTPHLLTGDPSKIRLEADLLRELLSVPEKLYLHEVMRFPLYILITLMWLGPSKVKEGECMKLVDQKIKGLKSREFWT